MDLTPANLSAMFTNFSLLYQEGYTSTPPWWRMLATLVPSKTETQTYGWMDKIPKLRKWIGARQVANVVARSQLVSNITFELTESVPKEKIQDDQYGLYAPLASQMGQQASKWPDQTIISDVFTANPTAFDGVAFFNASHPVDVSAGASGPLGTYSNLNASGMALTAPNFGAVRAQMRAFKGADGQPLNVTPNLLIVPPALEEAARIILNADFIASFVQGNATAGNVGSQINVWKGSADLLVIPELAGTDTTWYLADTTNVIKPFVFQLREAPQFAYLNRPTDPNVFWNREFIFGVEARGAATTSLPFLMVKSAA